MNIVQFEKLLCECVGVDPKLTKQVMILFEPFEAKAICYEQDPSHPARILIDRAAHAPMTKQIVVPLSALQLRIIGELLATLG